MSPTLNSCRPRSESAPGPLEPAKKKTQTFEVSEVHPSEGRFIAVLSPQVPSYEVERGKLDRFAPEKGDLLTLDEKTEG